MWAHLCRPLRATLLLALASLGCPLGEPSYTAAGVVLGSDGIAYLHSGNSTSLFRFSLATGKHLARIPLPASPTFLRYAPTQHTLYLVYGQEVTRINLNQGTVEQPFAPLVNAPRGAFVAGGNLVVVDRNFVTTFAPDGTQIARVAFYTYADTDPGYVWSEALERAFYMSSKTVLSFAVDPVTGTPSDLQYSPQDNEFMFLPPLRIATDGSEILVGRGDLLGSDLVVTGALPTLPLEALWLEDGGVITLADEAGDTRLEHWNPDRSLFQSMPLAGAPFRIVQRDGTILVVTQGVNRPKFHAHVPSIDPDGDGAPTPDDAFPLDAAASTDTDHDGFPDVWNAGEDESTSTTGLTLDAFPLDSACHAPEHGTGGLCDIAAQIGPYDPAEIAMGTDGIVYVLSPGEARVQRWSVAAGAPLNPIPTGPDPRAMAYFPERQKLYLGYGSGQITEVDLTTNLAEEPFAVTHRAISDLTAAGPHLLAADWFRYAFDTAGTTSVREWGSDWGAGHVYNPHSGRIYAHDAYYNNDLAWHELDSSGAIVAHGYTTYGPTALPIRISQDGSLVVSATGFVRDADTLAVHGVLSTQFDDAAWLPDGLLSIRSDAGGDTLVEHWDGAYEPVTSSILPGTPLRVLEWGGSYRVVTSVGGRPTFHSYSLGLDPDGDGVDSPQDAFPLDPAASLDSDGDGYPDAWNPGFGPGDSTTGLELDAFPTFAACQRVEDGVGGICDIAATIPGGYVPASIVVDIRDVAHLFSPENRRIYRFDLAAGTHLDPIPLGAGAAAMTYSESADRLFVAYPNRSVVRIDPLAPVPEERFFITWDVPLGLVAGDAFLLVVDGFGIDTGYMVDLNGSLLDTTSSIDQSPGNVYEWDPVGRRIFWFDNYSHDTLAWLELDEFGAITGWRTNSSYHIGYETIPPIRVSLDADHVLVGGGAIYHTPNLRFWTQLPGPIADGHWLDDGRLITIRDDGAGNTTLEQYGPDYEPWGAEGLPGEPVRLLAWSGGLQVVTRVAGRHVFQAYEVPDDSDGDGTDNVADDFPVDPAAAMDSDSDGHPDAWNPGMGAGDSTTGLVLDFFPDDVACHLVEHGVGGVCDFERVVPSTPGVPACASDQLGDLPESGSLTLEDDISDLVPLCDGWVIYSTASTGRVVVRHLPSGRTGLDIQLLDDLYELELDPEAKVVYGPMKREDIVVAVDLVSGVVAEIPVEDPRALRLGNNGDLYLVTNGPGYPIVVVLDVETGELGAGARVPSDTWAFNHARDEMVAGLDRGVDSLLWRADYDPVLGKTKLQEVWGGPPASNIAISPDGEHVVFPSVTGSSSVLNDLAGGDFSLSLGTFDIGASFGAIAFDPTGAILAASTGQTVHFFDVSTHQFVDEWEPPACNGGAKRIAFSRGANLFISELRCSQTAPPRLDWLRLD